ncbi:reverse transcriptase domain-containing protein [Tanacetum coccineum]
MSNTYEDDLSQPWTCEERNPFTHWIQHSDFPRTRMPSHVKTYDGSGDPKDHLKLFQSAAKTERWAMPTWCHMFNSTLTGNARVWFDKLPKESIDSYEDLRAAFRENYLQQTKHIKDPVEIHHIKQRDGESTEDFMERYKAEVLDVEGASKCMKISGFMYGITHPELIKRLYEKIPRSMDEIYRVTMSFLQGEVAAFSHSRKKAPTPWRQPEGGNKPNFKKGLKTSKGRIGSSEGYPLSYETLEEEIFALEKGKFKAPPPMLRKQIEEMIKSGEEGGTEGPMIIEAEIGGNFVHRIYVDGGAQKKKGQASERNKAIQEEVEKLIDAGIMKEVHYHSWLSNPVMVKKHDGSWRMCVDFKDLNKACPQDGYPLPEIDWKVESLCGYPFKCFLDAYKGYHQIKMAEEDKEKTSISHNPNGYSAYSRDAFGSAKRMSGNLSTGLEDDLRAIKVNADRAKSMSYTAETRSLLVVSRDALKMLQKAERKLANKPIRQLLSNSEITGRMLKWKFELEGYDIQYRPRISIKGQILADFIMERLEEDFPDELMAEPEELPEP